jgi:hypothetical protein
MSGVRESLRALGIRVPDGAGVEVRTELARVAGFLRACGLRSLGLVPAADDVGVPAIALQTGLALAEVTGRTTAVVDAQGSWLDDVPPGPAGEGGPVFMVTWLTERLALLIPRVLASGATVRDLEACLREETRAMGHLVVDLTGADHTGEYLEAMEMLDAVAVVARAGVTTSHQLARWMREIPAKKNLGVLLVGG